MDLLGIAALGGLERITIVAGAVIIGYWGYRLYTAEKNAGLVFMGLAVLVLVGALATGTRHLQQVSEDYQLASIPDATVDPAEQSPFAEAPAETSQSLSGREAAQPESPAPSAVETAAEHSETAMPDVSEEAPDADATPVQDMAGLAETEAVPEAVVSPVRRLATGQELGGRIVSVKSENVSLEWAPEPKSD